MEGASWTSMWLVLSSGKQNLATWSQFWKCGRCKNREVVESYTKIPDSHRGHITSQWEGLVLSPILC